MLERPVLTDSHRMPLLLPVLTKCLNVICAEKKPQQATP